MNQPFCRMIAARMTIRHLVRDLEHRLIASGLPG
jgi:hypothetical protein